MRYTLEGEHNDGSIVLKPDTSVAAIRERSGGVPVSLEEIERITGQPIPVDDRP
jgi:hypothetical protein